MKQQIGSYLLILSIITNFNFDLKSQCGYNSCESAIPLCSLNELNGTTCTANSSPDGFGCNGTEEYITWFSFLVIGDFTITISPISGCSAGSGIDAILYHECECNELASVKITTNPKTINYKSTYCNVYYLAIKNSINSTCQYNISTTITTIPKINGSLGKIFIPNGNSLDFCVSDCSQNVSVEYFAPKGSCFPAFIWTLDGNPVGENFYKNESILFQNEGTFELCVTAFLDPIFKGNRCESTNTVCTTVNVINQRFRIANTPRFICRDQIPFKWGNTTITEEGTYTANFKSGCCEFDSTAEFKFYYAQDLNTFYISCDGSIYTDPVTKIMYPGCSSKKKISFNTNPAYGCRNFYFLSTAYPKIKPKWIINNVNGNFEIDPNIQIKELCDAQIGIESYGWFKKSDPQQTIISKNKKLTVSTPDNYCLLCSSNKRNI